VFESQLFSSDKPSLVSDVDRHIRQSEATRGKLIDAALVEFSRTGFDGTSTRSIAARAGCHQPQINYHFTSKEALWEAAVDHLFEMLAVAIAPTLVIAEPVERFRQTVKAFVAFAARHPELNRIMVAEAMASSSRLTLIVDRYTRTAYESFLDLWRAVRSTGQGAAISDGIAYYAFVGAASLLWANQAEAVLVDPSLVVSAENIEAHADALIALFLPAANDAECM
jgi:TetR/AcrR family transcriptional regulator